MALASRLPRVNDAHAAAMSALMMRVETLASCLIDGQKAEVADLAKSEAGLPSTRAARAAHRGVDAFAAHVGAASRALGLGALAAAHTAPNLAPGARRAGRYRTSQTWLGGSDLWPMGADYVPPRAERVPALMDDLVDFCARTDLDPVAQAAIAHAQFLSIQPFPEDNGRAARALINGVWRRRGLTNGISVPVSASIAGDRRRAESVWRAFREGDADPIVSFVARHTLRALKEAAVSADRVALMPRSWMDRARPRRGSTSRALIDVLIAHPIVSAARVQSLTGASQASSYEAIVRLASAGVLRRLTIARRDTVWVAGDVIDEADSLLKRLGGVSASSSRPRP